MSSLALLLNCFETTTRSIYCFDSSLCMQHRCTDVLLVPCDLQKPLAALEVVSAEPDFVAERESSSSCSGMTDPTPKRTCTGQCEDPLGNAGILQHVVDYLSTRSYLYIGAVSSFWKQSYEIVALAEEKRASEASRWHRRVEISIPRKTNDSAAFQSVTTLTWAHTSGLQLQADNETLQYAAGEQASLSVLDALHGLGLAFDEHTLHGAVASEREDIVDFLYIQYDCPLAWYIGLTPARSGNTSMLRSLRQLGHQFDHFAMCSDAARGGHLEALKYLRSEGCSWFASTIAGHAAGSGNLEMVSTRCTTFRSFRLTSHAANRLFCLEML
jgi:hypothetical protein